MSDLNRVILMGHLGADPELRTTADGVSLLKIRMATTDVWLDKSTREREERTEWHTVTLFGNRVEGLSRILKKGDCIVVEGALRTSSWERDGVRRYRTEVIARDICLTGKKAPKAAPSVDEPAVEESAAVPASADAEDTLPSNAPTSKGRRGKPNGNGLAVPATVLVTDVPF